MLDTTVFWQMNIWGIAGTLLGVFGISVSLSNWSNSRAKVVITKLDLVRKNPEQVAQHYEHISKDRMIDQTLDFELNIAMRNKGNGSCSIGKPLLVFSLPSGKKIKISPFKAHYDVADKTDETSWNSKRSLETAAWKFEGRQILEEEVRYVIGNIDDLYEIVDNYNLTGYSIEYSDNLGRNHRKKIGSVLEES
ncbi:MAG: hypothetical protein P4L61_03645 [Candidatus Pacebacteria bacterium]|nr:hypothetical protein [Candidatus Paceibacterota bacterium]